MFPERKWISGYKCFHISFILPFHIKYIKIKNIRLNQMLAAKRWEDTVILSHCAASAHASPSLNGSSHYHCFPFSAAPNLKGRPRKKKLSISQRRDSQGHAQGQGSSGSTQGSTAVAAQDPCSPESKTTTKVRKGQR